MQEEAPVSKKKKKKKNKEKSKEAEEKVPVKAPTPPPPEPVSAADVAKMAAEVIEAEEQSSLNNMKSNLGQYTGATLDGGDARLDKFARCDMLNSI